MRTLIAFAVLACLSVRTTLAEEPAVTSQVSATIKVTGEANSWLLDPQLIMRAWSGGDRVLAAIKQVRPGFELQSPVEAVVRVAFVPGFDPTLPQVTVLNLHVESYDPQIDATAVLQELVKRFRKDWSWLDVQNKERVEKLASASR